MKLNDALEQAQRESDNERGAKDMHTQHKPATYSPRNEYRPTPSQPTIQLAPGGKPITRSEKALGIIGAAIIGIGIACAFYFA